MRLDLLAGRPTYRRFKRKPIGVSHQEVRMDQINQILVLSQPEFVGWQVGNVLTGQWLKRWRRRAAA